ncbi:alkaline phosphatase family protein [Candidatus Bipolaricaulota bacterium]|nr:alkaline phosphatase family protein [Candidatus Bipolaricaulota bacterium]
MRKAQEILARIQDETGGLRPHYERYSLLSVPHTIEELLGGEEGGLAQELGLRPADKVVGLLLDGLGYRKLEELAGEGKVSLSPFLDSGAYIPLTSVFPPTTTTALASLSTGASPLVHGVLGYTLFLQDPGAVVNMIKLAAPGAQADSLQKVGIKPEEFVPVPSLYRRLEALGVSTYLFLPKFIMDSGLSQILYQGVKQTVPYLSLSDLFVQLRGAVARPGKALLAVYWPSGDSLAHVYGPSSPAFAIEIATFFRLFYREFLNRVRRAVVILVADHGFVDVDPKKDVISCPEHEVLREGLMCPPVGDARAAYLYLRRGHEREVEDYLRERFPKDFLIMRSEEALDQGLWGLERPTLEARARVGDLLALAKGSRFLLWPKGEFKLRGMHGGLTEDEMLVPLLALQV